MTDDKLIASITMDMSQGEAGRVASQVADRIAELTAERDEARVALGRVQTAVGMWSENDDPWKVNKHLRRILDEADS